VFISYLATLAAVKTGGYVRTDRVVTKSPLIDKNGISHTGQVQDPNLLNPWSVTEIPTGSPFWVSDNNAGVATLYNVPALRIRVDKATGPAATEQLGGGAEKFGREKENRARSEHIAIILAEAVVIWGSRLRPSLRYESKTTTNGGETGEANPHSCKAGRNLGSDCRAVGHGAAASSRRPACCS
jgi:hypothetical protein